MLSYKYDIGLHIVPKHIFEGQDWQKFTAFDLDKGYPVTTGPWKVVNVSPTQKVMDRRDSWWGVAAGVGKLPEVERIVLLPDTGEQQLAQGLISNAVDFSTGLQVATFPTVFKGNPKIITFTGTRAARMATVDWWPTSLYLNNERPPFNNPKFRWAISYLIDRQTLIDVGWGGSSSLSPLPMPDGAVYKGLQPYFDYTKELLEKYPTNEFNPKKGHALLAELGWKKDGSGMYLDAAGKPFTMEIISFFDFPSVGPVLVELLKRQGMNATYGQPPDMFDRYFAGNYNAVIFGHGGSVKRSLCDSAPLSVVVGSDPGRPSRQPLALEERGIRQDRRSGRRDPAGRQGEDEGPLVAGDDDLAAGAAGCPADAVLSSPADEPDLLEGVSDEGRSLRQSGVLPLDLRARAASAGSDAEDVGSGNGRRVRLAGRGRTCLLTISRGGSRSFFLIVWLAATLNFFLPRIGGENPVAQKVMQMAALGGNLHAGMQDMVKEYEFQVRHRQAALEAVPDLSRRYEPVRFRLFDRQLSPKGQRYDLRGPALDARLITATTIISFVIGNILGAFQAWPRAPRWIMALMPPLLSLSAIPFFLLGLILVYVVGFRLQLAADVRRLHRRLDSAMELVVRHSTWLGTRFCRRLAIILGSLGGWALGMRAMMVTTQGEDYVTFAEAKGLVDRTLFLDYGIRNAMLPQVTALALSLGQLVSGAVLVEVVFGYPGIGTLLFQGIQGSDFFLVQGIVFIVIVAIGLATLILDLVYPLLDPAHRPPKR